MSTLQSTLKSPRMDGDIIKWYEGDAFYVHFNLMNEASKTPIVLADGDKVSIVFENPQGRIMKVFEITETIADKFPIHIDKETTRLFKVGTYHYDIVLHRNNDDTIQTLVKCAKAEVEGCPRR